MTSSRVPSLFRRLAIAMTVGAAFFTTVGRLSADVSINFQNPVSHDFPGQYAPGSSVTFTTYPVPSGACQWLHDGVPLPGATSANLTLTNLSSADSGNYQLKVTTGSSTETSNTLTINVLPFPPSPVDLVIADHLPANLVAVSVVQGAADGSLIVVCESTTNPSNARQIVRLRADGSQDTSVNLTLNSNSVLAVLSAGDLILSQAPYRIHVDGSAAPFTLPAGFDVSQPLSLAVLQPDGKLLVAQKNLIGRMNPDGTVDAGFLFSSARDGTIGAIHLDTNGRIVSSGQHVVAGDFRGFIYRLTPDGHDDPTFPIVNSLDDYCLAFPLADGSLFVWTQNSVGDDYLFRHVNADGTLDTQWSGQAFNFYFPTILAVDAATSRVFYVDNNFVLQRATATSTGLVNDPTFYPGEEPAYDLQLTPSGELFSGPVRLRTTDVTTVFPPVAIVTSYYPSRGITLTLSSTVTGTGPLSYQWLALDGQPLPANTTSPQLVIPNIDTVNLGRYQLRVTGAAGTVLSPVSVLAYDPSDTPYLANLSGRAFVGTGDDTAIAGFAVKIHAGALGLPLLLRGAGPALQPFGISNPLPNPVLNLYNTATQLIGNNDNWSNDATIAADSRVVGAFPFATDSHDAALVHTFGTGNGTLQLVDQGNGSGIGLLEIYRLPADNVPADLVNLSLRARTGAGDNVTIAGFVITDPTGFTRPLRLLLRVVGPTLSQSGVASPLADPILTLYDVNGHVVAHNDNWSDNANAADLAAATKQVGAFDLPAGSKDAALLIDVPAGIYSIQATGPAGAIGVALTEIYLVK